MTRAGNTAVATENQMSVALFYTNTLSPIFPVLVGVTDIVPLPRLTGTKNMVDLSVIFQNMVEPHNLETTRQGKPAVAIQTQAHSFRHHGLMGIDAAMRVAP